MAAVAGRYDVFVELVCRDSAHFQEVLVDSLQSVAGVQSTESFLILEIHKMAYGWGAGESGVPVADAGSHAGRRPAGKRARPARAGGKQR